MRGGDLGLIDLANGHRCMIELGGRATVTGVAFSRDNRRVAALAGVTLLGIWDVGRPDAVELTVHSHSVGIGYTPDGARFLVNSYPGVRMSPDGPPDAGGFAAHDTRTGLPVEREPAPTPAPGKGVRSYAFTRDDRVYLSEVSGGTITVHPVGGQNPTTITIPAECLAGSAPIWYPDGRKFLTLGGGVRQWDASGKEEWKLDLPTGKVTRDVPGYQPVHRMVKVIGLDGKETDQLRTEMQAVSTRMDCWSHTAAISPDGGVILVRPTFPVEGEAIRLIEGATGKSLGTLPEDGPVVCTVFSPNASRLAVLSGDQARVYDVRSGRLLFQLTTPGVGVLSAAFSPDGTRLVTGGISGGVVVWDARDGHEVCTLSNVFGRAQYGPHVVYGPHWGLDGELPVTQIAVASHGRVRLLHAR
jgi:WD40 repeat protein